MNIIRNPNKPIFELTFWFNEEDRIAHDTVHRDHEKEYTFSNGKVLKVFYDENDIAHVSKEFFEQVLIPALEKSLEKEG